MSREDQSAILEMVTRYDAFTPDEDPFGEHDCGSFSLLDDLIIWEIDYYDRTQRTGAKTRATRPRPHVC